MLVFFVCIKNIKNAPMSGMYLKALWDLNGQSAVLLVAGPELLVIPDNSR